MRQYLRNGRNVKIHYSNLTKRKVDVDFEDVDGVGVDRVDVDNVYVDTVYDNIILSKDLCYFKEPF